MSYPDTKDTRHGQAGEAATFCRPKIQRNGDSLADSPLHAACAACAACDALRTNLISHPSYICIWA